jgi:hypothetical protein
VPLRHSRIGDAQGERTVATRNLVAIVSPDQNFIDIGEAVPRADRVRPLVTEHAHEMNDVAAITPALALRRTR